MSAAAPPFEIVYDGQRRRLRWTLRGFWTMPDVARFAGAMRDAITPLGPPPHRFECLCDARDFPVQSHEVSEALGAIDRIGARMRVGRMAVVVGSVMNKLQVQRTLTQDVRAFVSFAEAEAWLAQPEDRMP